MKPSICKPLLLSCWCTGRPCGPGLKPGKYLPRSLGGAGSFSRLILSLTCVLSILRLDQGRNIQEIPYVA